MAAGGFAEFVDEEAVEGHGGDVEEAGESGGGVCFGEVVEHPIAGGADAGLAGAAVLVFSGSLVGEVEQAADVEERGGALGGCIESDDTGLLVQGGEQADLVLGEVDAEAAFWGEGRLGGGGLSPNPVEDFYAFGLLVGETEGVVGAAEEAFAGAIAAGAGGVFDEDGAFEEDPVGPAWVAVHGDGFVGEVSSAPAEVDEWLVGLALPGGIGGGWWVEALRVLGSWHRNL